MSLKKVSGVLRRKAGAGTYHNKIRLQPVFFSKNPLFSDKADWHAWPSVILPIKLVSLKTVLLLLALAMKLPLAKSSAPDIRSEKPDLIVPKLGTGKAGPGKRIRESLPGYEATKAYHVTYLPTDWQKGERYPVIVEYTGNNYQGAHGDVCTGRPEGSSMGYGISAGRGFIWVCLPYLNADGDDITLNWWGAEKNRAAQPTIDYCLKAVPWICEQYGGDPAQVVLCGFSRGAIACNYLGLHNDLVAKLWRAFIPYSHYDGIAAWPYPGSDRDSAAVRLKRLAKRPQFICHEVTASRLNLAATKRWLKSNDLTENLTFTETGFRNHNDAWLLRPSAARKQLRLWLKGILAQKR